MPTPTIIYASLVAHDSVRQRPHWLAEGLARHARVLWLEPHVSVLHQRPTLGRFTRAHERLAYLTPPTALPVTGYLPLLNTLSSRHTAHHVHRAVRTLGWEAPTALIATFPKHLALVAALRNRGASACEPRVLYDVMDDYPRFFGLGQQQVLERMHRALLASADAITTSSQTLAETITPHTRVQPVVLQNGVATEFIAACERAVPAAELASHGRPIFGYVGVISRWFDFEAVRRLATAFPQGTVALVGPVEVPTPPLPANVVFLGRRAHPELPSLLAAFDVGLVPFLRSPAIDAVNPVKVYEYWAAGLPVLGTPFDELERLRPHVITAPPDEWPAAAGGILTPPRAPTARSTVRAHAAANTWELRTDALLRVVNGSYDALPGVR